MQTRSTYMREAWGAFSIGSDCACSLRFFINACAHSCCAGTLGHCDCAVEHVAIDVNVILRSDLNSSVCKHFLVKSSTPAMPKRLPSAEWLHEVAAAAVKKMNRAVSSPEETGYTEHFLATYLGERRQPGADDFEPEPARWSTPRGTKTQLCFGWQAFGGGGASEMKVVEVRFDNAIDGSRGVPWPADWAMTPAAAQKLQVRLQEATAGVALRQTRSKYAVALACQYSLTLLGQKLSPDSDEHELFPLRWHLAPGQPHTRAMGVPEPRSTALRAVDCGPQDRRLQHFRICSLQTARFVCLRRPQAAALPEDVDRGPH